MLNLDKYIYREIALLEFKKKGIRLSDDFRKKYDEHIIIETVRKSLFCEEMVVLVYKRREKTASGLFIIETVPFHNEEDRRNIDSNIRKGKSNEQDKYSYNVKFECLTEELQEMRSVIKVELVGFLEFCAKYTDITYLQFDSELIELNPYINTSKYSGIGSVIGIIIGAVICEVTGNTSNLVLASNVGLIMGAIIGIELDKRTY